MFLNFYLKKIKNKYYDSNVVTNTNDTKQVTQVTRIKFKEIFLKKLEDMFETMKFDTYLTAHEAVEYGLADKVIDKRQW